jgi:Flp pilus assembly CpaF family ATPase
MPNSRQGDLQNNPLFAQWLKNVCLTNCNLMIYGPTGSGKTSLLLDLKTPKNWADC